MNFVLEAWTHIINLCHKHSKRYHSDMLKIKHIIVEDESRMHSLCHCLILNRDVK